MDFMAFFYVPNFSSMNYSRQVNEQISAVVIAEIFFQPLIKLDSTSQYYETLWLTSYNEGS